MKSKFLLLLGPTGVGKSTIIHHLLAMDERFVYISPYTTRVLRPGEIDKIHVSEERMQELERGNELIAVNRLYGTSYGTPKKPIIDALSQHKFPVLDWPVQQLQLMNDIFRENILPIYIAPASLEVLTHRLQSSKRLTPNRFTFAQKEFSEYVNGSYSHIFTVVNDVDPYSVAIYVYRYYCTAISY